MQLTRVTIEITAEGWTTVGFVDGEEKFRCSAEMTSYGCRPGDVEKALGGAAHEDEDNFTELHDVLDDLQSAPYDVALFMREGR